MPPDDTTTTQATAPDMTAMQAQIAELQAKLAEATKPAPVAPTPAPAPRQATAQHASADPKPEGPKPDVKHEAALDAQMQQIKALQAQLDASQKQTAEATALQAKAADAAVRTALRAAALMAGLSDEEHLTTSRFAIKTTDYYSDSGVDTAKVEKLVADVKAIKPAWFTAPEPAKVPAVTATLPGTEATSSQAAAPTWENTIDEFLHTTDRGFVWEVGKQERKLAEMQRKAVKKSYLGVPLN